MYHNISVTAIDSLNQLSASYGSASDQSLPKNILAGNFTDSSAVSLTQSRMLSHVQRCATRFGRRRLDSSELGLSDADSFACFYETSRNFAEMDLLSRQLRNADLTPYTNKPTASVVPIIADRISLPRVAGSVELVNMLPRDVHDRYVSPSEQLFRPEADRPAVPRARRCASETEWVKLVRRLIALDMVDFTTAPKAVCGVFAVPKDADHDRLIIDAQPANAMFIATASAALPTPDLLAKLQTDKSKPLFVAKVDLDNFYHRLRMPVWLRPYFALPPVRAGDVGLAERFGADTMIHPCCVTLPMGWSHSVLLAQTAHEHFLNTRTNLASEDRITAETDRRVDRVRHQCYIDDMIFVGSDEAAVRAAQDSYVEAVRQWGLVVKPEKVVRPSRAGVECLGLLVDGTSHTVGLSVPKLQRLIADTSRLLAVGSAKGEDMAHIVGRWSWALLAARPAFAVFNAVYRFIDCAGRRVFRVWATVARELRVVMGLAPLLFTCTADEWCDRVVAVDASSTGMGVVATPARVDAAPAVTSAAEAKTFANDSRWSTIVSSRWRKAEHINVLELRALCTAVRWALSRSHAGPNLMVLSDSQVVVGAINKGRSSSQLLLRRLRHLSALLIGSGLRVTLHWIPSADNPADGPSRR